MNSNQLQPGAEGQSTLVDSATVGLTQQDADLYARFFKVMGDPTRIGLLYLLLDAPVEGRTVGELVNALGVAQGRVSTHLGCLRWCGLVTCERSGKHMRYRLADSRIRDILRLGGEVMQDHAAGIASCGVIR